MKHSIYIDEEGRMEEMTQTFRLDELTGEAYNKAFIQFCNKYMKCNLAEDDLKGIKPEGYAETEKVSAMIGCKYDKDGNLIEEA